MGQASRGTHQSTHTGRDAADSAIAAAVLGRLAAALDELPERATLAGWGNAWQRLARQTGLLAAAIPRRRRLPVRGDREAWNACKSRCGEERPAGRMARPRRPPSWIAAPPWRPCWTSPPAGGCGRAATTAAASASSRPPASAGLRVPYLFLAGLSEKSFPSPQREDRLYGEAEYAAADRARPAVGRRGRSGAARRCCCSTRRSTRATRRLWLSYPAMDEAAQPLSPSPYLKEVEQACGEGRIARTVRIDLSPVPAGDEPLSPAEFRVKAVAAALEGNVSLLAGLLQVPPQARRRGRADLCAGLLHVALRQDREQFGPAEGMLSERGDRRRWRPISPRGGSYSATELEQYAACPFRYFLARVLHVEPLEELALEIDFLERGRLAHELMAALHRRVNQAPRRPGLAGRAEPRTNIDRLSAETLEKCSAAAGGDPVRDALREVDRRLLVQWLADYRRQHQQYDALWQDCQSPLRAGVFRGLLRPAAARSDGPPSTAEPLELDCGDADDPHRRPDRPHRHRPGGGRRRCSTCWTTRRAIRSRFSVEAVARGLALQLPLYAMAVAKSSSAIATASPGRPATGTWPTTASSRRRRCGCTTRPTAALEPEPEWEAIRARIGPRRSPDWSAAFAAGSSPSAAPTPTAPAIARSPPSAASTRSVPWRRHGSRRCDTGLTEQQQRALAARGVSVALSAGAGCGKTFVLTERFLAAPGAGPGGRAAARRGSTS